MPLWLVGVLIGGESLLQASLDIPAGYLLDRFGYRRLLKLTAFCFIATCLCLVTGLSVTTYVLTIAFSVLGWLFFVPGMNAYILSHADERESEKFFSIRDVSNAIGVVCASVSLPFVLLFSPQAAGFLLLIIIGVATVCIFMSPEDKRLPPVEAQHPVQRRHLQRHTLRKLFHTIRKLNPASGMLVLMTFCASGFYAMIWFTVPLVIALEQANAGFLGVGLAVFDFSIVVLGYFIGRLANQSNRRTFVFFGLLLFSLCGMALGFNFGILFILFGFLCTTGDEMASISLWSWLHHLDREHDQDGAVSGVITLADDLGYGIGPIAAGILYTAVGPSWTITLGAIPLFLVWFFYYTMVHKHFSPTELSTLIPLRLHRTKHKS